MTPPRTTAEAPGTSVRVAVTSPPVSDSAEATVRAASRRALRVRSAASWGDSAAAGSRAGGEVIDPSSTTGGPRRTLHLRAFAGLPQPVGLEGDVEPGHDRHQDGQAEHDVGHDLPRVRG